MKRISTETVQKMDELKHLMLDGKSRTARQAAEELGMQYIDTYRILTIHLAFMFNVQEVGITKLFTMKPEEIEKAKKGKKK